MSADPGFFAVPGSMEPGAAWPGNPAGDPSDAEHLAIFTGSETLTYSQYLDAGTQRTLTAVPGHEYDIEVASGYPGNLPGVPGDGRWIPEGS